MKKFTRKEIENVVKELNIDEKMTEKHEMKQDEIVAFVKDFIKTVDQCIAEKQDITSIIYIEEWKDEPQLLKTAVMEILERKWMIKEFK